MFGVPLKLFWLKPSMTLWTLINVSFLGKEVTPRALFLALSHTLTNSASVKQYELYHTITLPMALYQIFTLIYVVDYFFLESYMTSTWDIIAEKSVSFIGCLCCLLTFGCAALA